MKEQLKLNPCTEFLLQWMQKADLRRTLCYPADTYRKHKLKQSTMTVSAAQDSTSKYQRQIQEKRIGSVRTLRITREVAGTSLREPGLKRLWAQFPTLFRNTLYQIKPRGVLFCVLQFPNLENREIFFFFSMTLSNLSIRVNPIQKMY